MVAHVAVIEMIEQLRSEQSNAEIVQNAYFTGLQRLPSVSSNNWPYLSKIADYRVSCLETEERQKLCDLLQLLHQTVQQLTPTSFVKFMVTITTALQNRYSTGFSIPAYCYD